MSTSFSGPNPRPPAPTSSSSSSSSSAPPPDKSPFESQRAALVHEIANSMEHVLANINKLNRALEGVIAVGNEFASVEALWSRFEAIAPADSQAVVVAPPAPAEEEREHERDGRAAAAAAEAKGEQAGAGRAAAK